MPLILFIKDTTFMDKYNYEAGVIYKVPQRLADKFCSQMGVAMAVEKADNIQPNPSAEMYDGENVVAAPEPAPVRKVPDTPPEASSEGKEPEEDTITEDPLYELKGKGGPWWEVVDIATGSVMNEKALKKDDAETLLQELLKPSVDEDEVS